MKKIYLDYAATTPVDFAVAEAMQPYFTERFGNPGSLHSFGQEAMRAVDEARETIANAIGAQFREVIFTGSATEANNLALRGVVNRAMQIMRIHANAAKKREEETTVVAAQPLSRRSGQAEAGSESRRTSVSQKLRIIVSSIEHESTLETARDLEQDGVEVVYIPVDEKGIVDSEKLKAALNERTVGVSVMYANNELGTVQSISEIAKIIDAMRTTRMHANAANGIYPLFHTDAVQAFQFLDCNVDELGVDLMTLSAHKIYGPKGAGALYIRNSKHEARSTKQARSSKFKIQNVSDFEFRGSNLQAVKPLVMGGGQEFGLRSGTENVASIVGFAKAVEMVVKSREKEHKRIAGLRAMLWDGIKRIYPETQLNGRDAKQRIHANAAKNPGSFVDQPFGDLPSAKADVFVDLDRLPNILNVYFPHVSSHDLLVQLDLKGVAVSAGSACAARSTKPSYVLSACGFSEERVHSSVRFSLGRYTTEKEIEEALERLQGILGK